MYGLANLIIGREFVESGQVRAQHLAIIQWGGARVVQEYLGGPHPKK